jgi:hypothetical protein
MEVRSSEEARQSIENFTKAYIELMLKKKELDAEIKDLKDAFKEEGVAVSIVCSVLNVIKSEKKQPDSVIFEKDKIKEWLQGNPDIDNLIGELMAK